MLTKVKILLFIFMWFNLNFILTELIQKAKDAVEVKKREDLKMLKEQMEDALKVRTALLCSA